MGELTALDFFAHLHHLELVSDIVELLVQVGDELLDAVSRNRLLVRWLDDGPFFEDLEWVPNFVMGVASLI